MTASIPSFAINGRFLTQSVTGVQRYAHNVVLAMNARLLGTGACAKIIAPPSARDPALDAMPLQIVGPIGGHVWEQTILPAFSRTRLLNLCNLAPATKTDQVVCIHDANIFVTPESYSYAFRRVYSALQRMIVKRSIRIATVSADSARQIARFLPVSATDIAVLPNGHEHALGWDPSLARLNASQGEEPFPRKFILALGSQARHKNLKLLIDAAPAIDAMGFDIVVAGGGAGIFAADTMPSVPNLKLLGYVTDHDLAYLMDRAICLAFPSWTEGFGLPIVEAMARGCPVISSDRASMPEICGDAALLAPPDMPSVWVRHVYNLVMSRGLRQELIGRGRERIQQFSWSKTAEGYLQLMHDPCSGLNQPD